MKDIIIHDDLISQFIQPSHLLTFIVLLAKADEDGVFRGKDGDIASITGLTQEEVTYIIDNILDVERTQEGVNINDIIRYKPVKTSDEIADEIVSGEDELILSSEKPRKRHERRSRTTMPTLEQKFQNVMKVFYPNLCKIHKGLTLAEYNILIDKIVAETGLDRPHSNELLIETLQAMNEYPKIKTYKDAYASIINWLNRKISHKSFNIEYYANINIEARKHERDARKKCRQL